MYIVAIAWIYVVFMMAITEHSIVAAVMTFVLYGVFPLSIVLYLMGTPQRKRNRQRSEKFETLAEQSQVSVSQNTVAAEQTHCQPGLTHNHPDKV